MKIDKLNKDMAMKKLIDKWKTESNDGIGVKCKDGKQYVIGGENIYDKASLKTSK